MKPIGTKKGLTAALSAFFIWGLSPVYYDLFHGVSAEEIILHRVLWSVLLCGGLVLLFKRGRSVLLALRQPKVIAILVLTSSIIAFNWYIFIWSIGEGRVLEASLGYYINPLVNILLGMVLLGERLNRLQTLAVALASVGVAYQAIQVGVFPWISLSLAFSFAFYGYFRKIIPVESLEGLFLETLLLAPFAAVGLFFFFIPAEMGFATGDWLVRTLLVGTSVVTATPLLLFAIGARNLTLTAVGICQYLAPSLHFILAVSWFGETLTIAHFVTFGFIWSALALYTFDGIMTNGRNRSQAASA